jgi:hypothetical protein
VEFRLVEFEPEDLEMKREGDQVDNQTAETT